MTDRFRLVLAILVVFLLAEEAEPLTNRQQALIHRVERELKNGTLIASVESEIALRYGKQTATPSKIIDVLNRMVATLEEAKAYSTGTVLATEVLKYAKANLEQNHPFILTSINNLAALYESQSRYDEAEPLLKRLLLSRERLLGPEHPETLSSMHSLGLLYEKQGRYVKAESLLKRVAALREKVLGSDHPNTLGSVNDLANLYERQGRYDEAERLLKWAVSSFERVLGPDHLDTLISVSNLAALYQSRGRYSEAEPLLKRVLPSFERMLGPDHTDTLTILNNLAALYSQQGRYSDAEPILKRTVALKESILGQDHPDTLVSVNNLAFVYLRQSRYSDAEPLLKQAVSLRERVLGLDHPDTLMSVNNLASLYNRQGHYNKAEPLLKRAVSSFKRRLGPDHPDTLRSINNLAALHDRQGRFGEAERLFKRTLASRERVLGPDHPDTLHSVNNLASLYESQGLYGEAAPRYLQALLSKERVLGADHPDTLTSVNNLAFVYSQQGQYSRAEQLYQRALSSNERVLGKDHHHTFTSVNNLASLYESQGRYGEAEPLYQRALSSRERLLGLDHPETLQSLNNLASLYSHQRRYGEAGPLYQQALSRLEQSLGPDHPSTLINVSNLASFYVRQERYGEAERLYHRALSSSKRVLGPDHPDTLQSMSNLAFLYTHQGRYDDAEPLSQQVLSSSERVLGSDHPSTIHRVNNLASLYARQERYDAAELLYRRALSLYERVLGLNHPNTLNTQINYTVLLVNMNKMREALNVLKSLEPRLFTFAALQLQTTAQQRVRRQFLLSQSTFQNLIFTLAARERSYPVRTYAAGVLLRWKQLQADEDAYMSGLIRTTADPQLKDMGQRLMALRSQLSHMFNSPDADPTELIRPLRMLETQEAALAAHSRRYKQHLTARSVRLGDLRAQLPAGSALIEMRVYRPFNLKTGKRGEPRFLALLLPAEPMGTQSWQLVDLGPIVPTRKQWSQLQLADSRSKTKAADRIARELYQKLFGAFDAQIADLDTLYIAPDGFLHLVPFARLILPDGRYWIERQMLRRLQTGRDLLRSARPSRSSRMLALGGVDFRQHANKQKHDTESTQNEFLSATRQTAKELPHFKTLPASGDEAEQVAKLYRRHRKSLAVVWQGRGANERRLKALQKAPRVLHLATHGFYLRNRTWQAERPLVTSGLSLAGANQGLQGKLGPGGEDGILYSLEVSGLNLHGTDLVSLSACDTGKGVVDYSEGVYGLVRAFRTAGAQRVLMTLWSVGDRQAKDFMVRFYEFWLQQNMRDPAYALRQTYLAYIHHEEPRLRNPRVWAPYVLVGN